VQNNKQQLSALKEKTASGIRPNRIPEVIAFFFKFLIMIEQTSKNFAINYFKT